MKYIRITHKASGLPLAEGPLGWVVTLVKKQTRQWDLDHRLPVQSYTRRFFYQGDVLPEEFSTDFGAWYIPTEAAMGEVSLSLSDFVDELTDVVG